jgi:eukaryotic-like serine/threonine-protein kinase
LVGQTISHYKITDKLGEGGMGVVYKAEDTKLHRTVALKFLRPDAVESRELKARFLTEAEAAAALIHPNICVVHEIDEADGQSFIAMEYVEGQSLAEKIKKRPLPLDEALGISAQVAEGLHAAHKQGIVHRDIKPANIMIDPEGRAKIMDFGLAHLDEATRITQTGAVMGTPAYMSPEQVRGEQVDHRTDIWSLGVVLYEMVVGGLPFRGGSAQMVAVAIQNDEPEPITAQRAGVPLELEWVVAKTMAKSPDERYPHADDMLVDLRGLRRDLESKTTVSRSVQAAAPRWRSLLPWAVAALVSFVALWGLWRQQPKPPEPVVKISVNLAPGQTVANPPALALSRDGAVLAYAVNEGGETRIYLRRIDEFESRPVAGTDGGAVPFFSPDAAWLGFIADGYLKKVAVSGGSPQNICKAGVVWGADWGDDNNIVFGDFPDYGLWQVPASGGEPRAITSRPGHFVAGELEHFRPQLLPNGQGILFTGHDATRRTRVAVLSSETGERKTLVEDGALPRYSPTGHILYSQQGDLLAIPFNTESLEVAGAPAPVQTGLQARFNGISSFDLSRSGTLAFVPGEIMERSRRLVWVNQESNVEPLPVEGPRILGPRFSPDGSRIVYVRDSSVWTYELERGITRRLTDDEFADYWPIWTPDGASIIFNSYRTGSSILNLFSMSADGSGAPELLVELPLSQRPRVWAEDGKTLLFDQGTDPETGIDIWKLAMQEEFRAEPLIRTPADEKDPDISPDGQWIVYSSNSSGRSEVYVQPYPSLSGLTQVSTNGGIQPAWGPDGREIFYRDPGGTQMWSVAFFAEQAPRVAGPRLRFEVEQFSQTIYGREYDITPDGNRFVVTLEETRGEPATRIHVVVNWAEELERKLAGAE